MEADVHGGSCRAPDVIAGSESVTGEWSGEGRPPFTNSAAGISKSAGTGLCRGAIFRGADGVEASARDAVTGETGGLACSVGTGCCLLGTMAAGDGLDAGNAIAAFVGGELAGSSAATISAGEAGTGADGTVTGSGIAGEVASDEMERKPGIARGTAGEGAALDSALGGFSENNSEDSRVSADVVIHDNGCAFSPF